MLKTSLITRIWLYAFVSMTAALIVALRVSVIDTPVRLLVVCVLGLVALALAVGIARAVRRSGRARLVIVLLVLLFAGWFAFGARPVDPDGLRQQYVRELGSFEHVHYVWGGETHSGIDCSGLPRVSLWRSMLKQGIRTGNPRLLGPRLWKFWMRDVGAKGILLGSYGFTREIGHEAPGVAGCDTSFLRPGDMAVTRSGVHVMVFYGGNRWIDAGPDYGEVVVNPAPADAKRDWFRIPVRFFRWRILEIPYDRVQRS